MSRKHVFTTGSQTGKENLLPITSNTKAFYFTTFTKKEERQRCDVEGTQMISEYPLTPCMPFLSLCACLFLLCICRRVISVICTRHECTTSPPPTPTSQAGGTPVANAVRSSWPGSDSHTMRHPLCNLYSTFPKHGNVAQPSTEQ